MIKLENSDVEIVYKRDRFELGPFKTKTIIKNLKWQTEKTNLSFLKNFFLNRNIEKTDDVTMAQDGDDCVILEFSEKNTSLVNFFETELNLNSEQKSNIVINFATNSVNFFGVSIRSMQVDNVSRFTFEYDFIESKKIADIGKKKTIADYIGHGLFRTRRATELV